MIFNYLNKLQIRQKLHLNKHKTYILQNKFKQNIQNKFKQYVTQKIKQMHLNNYNPDLNNKKYLLIMASHCINEIKFSTIKNNFKFLNFNCFDKLVVNSEQTEYGKKLSEFCKNSDIKYYEIPNSGYLDFGKFINVLIDKNKANYLEYDYIILLNDSFIIHKPINHFFNLISKYNIDLYGYNDSTQSGYHYQSYLFSLRRDAVQKFIDKVTNPSLNIKTQQDVICNFELNMTKWFTKTSCFLEIGNYPLHRGLNIYHNNDRLYFFLKNIGLLPFTKLKRYLKIKYS